MKKILQFLHKHSDKNWHYIIPVLNIILIAICFPYPFCSFSYWSGEM